MDVHQNARLTLHCRVLLVERVLRGRPKIEVAAEFGISVKTVSKWVRRFQAEGPAGLRDRSCRPQRCPAATVRELELAVLALRRQRLTLVSIATRPYTPRTNGNAERFIQTALREWAYARAYHRSSQRIAELPRWLHNYNRHRPHASLASHPCSNSASRGTIS